MLSKAIQSEMVTGRVIYASRCFLCFSIFMLGYIKTMTMTTTI
jgi:hypothetical protein